MRIVNGAQCSVLAFVILRVPVVPAMDHLSKESILEISSQSRMASWHFHPARKY